MNCPNCGGPLTELLFPNTYQVDPELLECRRCDYPNNRWFLALGSVDLVRYDRWQLRVPLIEEPDWLLTDRRDSQ